MRRVDRIFWCVCVGVCSILLLGCPNRIDVAASGEHAGMMALSMVPVGRAFDRLDVDTSEYELYIGDLDGSGLQRLTWNDGADMQPDWSLDSSKIAYLHEGRFLDDSGRERSVVLLAVYDFAWQGSFVFYTEDHEFSEHSYPDFGPNDTIVASNGDGGLVTVEYRDGEFVNERVLYDGEDAFFPVWSPGGDWVAFNEDLKRMGAIDRHGRNVVFADPESLVGELDGVTQYRPIWVSSNEIWFTGYTEDEPIGNSYIFSFDVRDARTEVVAELPGIAFGYASLSPDGRHLVGLNWQEDDNDEEEAGLMAYHIRENQLSSFLGRRVWTEESAPTPVWSYDSRKVMIWDAGSFVTMSPWGSLLSSFDLGQMVYRTNMAQ